jgi:hypothetical protein
MNFNLLNQVAMFMQSGERHQACNANIDPNLAYYIVSEYNWENQRPANDSHIKVLAEAIRVGDFREYTNIDFAIYKGRPHLINGQHTLRAVHLAEKTTPLSVHFYRVENEHEIESLYSKYDVGRRRTLRDSMGSIGDELDMSPNERDKLGAAISVLYFELQNPGMTAVQSLQKSKDFEFKKQLMREWSPEAKLFYQCISEATRYDVGIYYRSPVFAVALATLRHAPEKSITFWTGMALDDGLRHGDPRKTVLNWLRNHSIRQNRNQHRAVISAWNAWYAGRELNKIYAGSDKSMSIDGTPFNMSAKPGPEETTKKS